jgi:triphosphoribosyl-dephospho-CoA synthase
MAHNALAKLTNELAKIYKIACLAEVEAIKPGNVHIFADGHGMQVHDFIQSAEVSSAVIAQANLTLGERVFRSIEATWHAVNCNTNLGIVLLCAPIIHTLQLIPTTNLRVQLANVLNELTKDDTQLVFRAIQLAKPAGLGHVSEHDVNEEADCSLLEAMQASSSKDLIARQYANNFTEVFDEGLPFYQEAFSRWQRPAWATTALYLYWLSHYPDSHIARKYGLDTANQVKLEAEKHFYTLAALENPKQYLPQLLTFDSLLKTRGINPGTSADLTVAVLLLHNLAEIGYI